MSRTTARGYRQLTLWQLEKRAHSDDGARTALRRYEELALAGARPIICYSEFNGYLVSVSDEETRHERDLLRPFFLGDWGDHKNGPSHSADAQVTVLLALPLAAGRAPGYREHRQRS